MLKNLKIYSISVLAGLIIGLLTYYLQPVKWQGEAIIKIGHKAQGISGNLIEPIPLVSERLKSTSFIIRVAERTKSEKIFSLLSNGVSIKPIRNSDAIKIILIGDSEELVRLAVDSISEELLQEHNEILDEYKSDVIKQLTKLEEEIETISQRKQEVYKNKSLLNTAPTSEQILASGLELLSIQLELDNKLNEVSKLKQIIGKNNIRETNLVEPTYTSQQKIFNSLSQTCLLGALLGLMLSIIYLKSNMFGQIQRMYIERY